MADHELFEAMLATYPAEKRELARQVYHRFADGDSAHFFSQLFLILDVYAHYTEAIPRRMMAANADTLATIQEIHGEIEHLAETSKARDADLAKHVREINQLCQATQAKCNEAVTAFEKAVQSIANKVDTKAIVADLQTSLHTDIQKGIIRPFVRYVESLIIYVAPTLQEIKDFGSEAKVLWTKRIWRTAWLTCILWSTFASLIVIALSCWLISTDCNRKLAAQITATAQVMKFNQVAFQQLAVAQVPIQVLPVQDEPQSIALIVENAYAADRQPMDSHTAGRIFVKSGVSEKQIRQVEGEINNVPASTNVPVK
jgi:hypothetical protein